MLLLHCLFDIYCCYCVETAFCRTLIGLFTLSK